MSIRPRSEKDGPYFFIPIHIVTTEPTLFSAVFTKIVINNSAYEILYPGLL